MLDPTNWMGSDQPDDADQENAVQRALRYVGGQRTGPTPNMGTGAGLVPMSAPPVSASLPTDTGGALFSLPEPAAPLGGPTAIEQPPPPPPDPNAGQPWPTPPPPPSPDEPQRFNPLAGETTPPAPGELPSRLHPADVQVNQPQPGPALSIPIMSRPSNPLGAGPTALEAPAAEPPAGPLLPSVSKALDALGSYLPDQPKPELPSIILDTDR